MRILTVSEVLPLVQAYYKFNGVGGSLHIVLDDGNLEDDSVEFCLRYARDNHDIAGQNLAKVLLRMSRKQRQKLYDQYEKFHNGV